MIRNEFDDDPSVLNSIEERKLMTPPKDDFVYVSMFIAFIALLLITLLWNSEPFKF